MKNFILSLFILVGNSAFAQSNIFLGRDFWKTQPSVEQVQEKIAEGNSPTEMNQWSFDATVYAIISHAPTNTIKYLTTIEGNELDKVTHDGRNYLLWASYAGNYELVNYLLQQGSDIHWVDDHQFDIVTFTAFGGNTDPALYDLYKKHGLVLNDSKRKGANALLIAAPSVKDISELDYFIQNGMHWTDVDDEGNNLFLSAASKGNIQLLQQLMDKGVDPKVINKNGENAILIAAQGARRHSNNLETFTYLTDIGLDPQKINNDGNNALHLLAVSNPNWDIFEYFIKQNVAINAVNKKGETPYMLALKYGNQKVTSSLFERTKDYNQTSEDGYTALSYSVANQDLNSFKSLLNKNVNTDIVTSENESLINILFKNYNPKKTSEFEEMLNMLVKNGVKPTTNSKNGNNLFHIAVQQQEPTLVSYAQALGVNIDAMNAEGLTPLHLAAMTSENLDMLKSLKTHNANVRINTEFGEDAFVLALENELLDITLKDLDFLKATNH